MRAVTRGVIAIVGCLIFTVKAVEVQNSVAETNPKLDITVVSGTVSLPFTGVWELAETGEPAAAVQVQLVPPQGVIEKLRGRRITEVENQRRTEQGRYALRSVRWMLIRAANERKLQQLTYADLTQKKKEEIEERLNHNPFGAGVNVQPPFYHLFEDFVLEFEERENSRRHNPVNDALIAVELHPYLDDGKHFVATAGGVERVEIDTKLAEKHGYQVVPVRKTDEGRGDPETVDYTLYALADRDAAAENVELELVNRETGEKLTVQWPITASVFDTSREGLIQQWAQARANSWNSIAATTNAPVFKTWMELGRQLYGIEGGGFPGRNRGRTTSMFSMFSGRAAVRETLQMQLIGDGREEAEEQTVPIDAVKGVEVKSHPYAEMARNVDGVSLALADITPVDRFFLYIAKPETIVPLLEESGEFMFRFGSIATENAVARDLKQRYLQRLGMNEEWLKAVLKSGAVREMSLMLPDLFLADGTDITVAARVPQMNLLRPLLSTINVTASPRPSAVRTPAGANAYWAVKDDLLIISTSEQEAENVLALANGTAQLASLGQSDEWKYMTSELQPREDTRYFAYFSDPFIRRLVGPEVKIAQLRRLREVGRLELVTAAALLYRLDGHKDTPTVASLEAAGYIPEGVDTAGLELQKDYSCVSDQYGRLGALDTLLEHPVTMVTAKEKTLYDQYRARYSQFWRQFFDPIAVRVDEAGDRSLEMTTYILPLVDSSIYNGLRGTLRSDAGQTLRIPQLTPEPVLMLSANFGEQFWLQVTRGFRDMLVEYAGLNPRLLDELGPSIHFAVKDADPVIALGSGDVMGVFGASGMRFFSRSQMLTIPMLLATLTRPVTLLIELKNPEAVTDIMKTLNRPHLRSRDRDVQAEFVQVEDREEWIYTIQLFGLLKLRYGITVQDDYLVISNIPWTQDTDLQTKTEAPLGDLALTVLPENVEKELPALFTSAVEKNRAIAMEGIGYLTPLLLTVSDNVEDARNRHAELFGFKPVHLGEGHWVWKDGAVVSTEYGTINQMKQPSFKDGNFGLMQNIEKILLNMQFEDEGFRSILNWQLKPGQ